MVCFYTKPRQEMKVADRLNNLNFMAIALPLVLLNNIQIEKRELENHCYLLMSWSM